MTVEGKVVSRWIRLVQTQRLSLGGKGSRWIRLVQTQRPEGSPDPKIRTLGVFSGVWTATEAVWTGTEALEKQGMK